MEFAALGEYGDEGGECKSGVYHGLVWRDRDQVVGMCESQITLGLHYLVLKYGCRVVKNKSPILCMYCVRKSGVLASSIKLPF